MVCNFVGLACHGSILCMSNMVHTVINMTIIIVSKTDQTTGTKTLRDRHRYIHKFKLFC